MRVVFYRWKPAASQACASYTWAAGWHAGLSAFAIVFAGFGANSKGLIYKEYRGNGLQATT